MAPPAMSSECPHICSTATKSSTRSKQDVACVGFLSEKDFARLTSVKRCDVCDESTTSTTAGLWLCLFPDCYMLGCSEDADHSSSHAEEYPQHAIQINIDTLRMWCYKCNKEIHVVDDGTLQIGGLVRPGRSGVSEARPCKELSNDAASMNTQARPPAGRVGLANLGNTCYMNAALQCLLNTTPLTDFFLTVPCVVSRAEKNNTSRAYLKLVEEIWGKPGVRYVAPSAVLYAMKTAHPMFRGFQQHDAQEFLRCFMDQMHEELCDPATDHLDEDANEAAEDEARRQDEEDRPEQSARGGEGEDDRLDSVSLHSSGAMEDDPDEYETADSGVSEQSSASSSFDGHDEATRGIGTRRKRKHTSQASHAMGDSMDSKRERGDSCSSGINTTGASASTSTTLSQTSRSNSSLAMAHASDVELEFCDAVSGSPPPSIASSTRALCPRQPTSVAKPMSMPVIRKRRPKTYRSVVTDIFDGKLVSSVQCLTCNQVSATTEAFQDLSLPIPTSETISALRGQASASFPSSPNESSSESGWLSWAWSWISGWFYGPNITLSDCLAGFFSADELKGDNMYSCEKCKKLRNGLKYSRVTQLPDSLCIHLKRFRHEFSFSSKISSRVAFPLVDFDMSQWLHKEAKSKVTLYDLYGVICHHGSAGGGHYTAYAINSQDHEWYEFDDSSVTRVDASTVMNSEAYVLFYRKNNSVMDPLRVELQSLLQRCSRQGEHSLVQFFVSKQWLNKFENFAEPGPIENEFLCPHGGVMPAKVGHVYDLCVALPQAAWELLHGRFGGGPPCTRLFECATCRAEATALAKQKKFELEEFKALHAEFQETENPSSIYCLSSSWFRQWEAFVTGRQRDPPPAIDNKSIVSTRPGGAQVLRPGSDYLQISRDIWQLLHAVYGGGPEIVVRLNGGGVTVSAAGAGVKPSSLRLRTRSTSEAMLKSPPVVPGRVKVKSESLHASSTPATSSPHFCSDEDADC